MITSTEDNQCIWLVGQHSQVVLETLKEKNWIKLHRNHSTSDFAQAAALDLSLKGEQQDISAINQ